MAKASPQAAPKGSQGKNEFDPFTLEIIREGLRRWR